MTSSHIIFIPGKNPKPSPAHHTSLLWRSLLEGVYRAESMVAKDLQEHQENFKLLSWNYLYYHRYSDINRDLSWIDALLNQHGPSKEDINEATSTHRKLHRALYNIIDHLPFLLKFLPSQLQSTANEIRRYFKNKENIACDIRELLKQQLRPLLQQDDNILIIGHSMGSIIAYDTLWELSHLEKNIGKVDLLTIGSPLGMNYVQKRLQGNQFSGNKKYPTNIKNWVNISAEGDVTALDRIFSDDFHEMLQLNIIDSIQDHAEGIFNYFHNEKGLNCHRSYGYLVNPAVGKVIADWWHLNEIRN